MVQVDTRSQSISYSRPRNNGDSEDQFVVEDGTDDVSISLYSICTSTKIMHLSLSMYCPTPSELYGVIVGQTECVKYSPTQAPVATRGFDMATYFKSFVYLCLYQLPHI